eukprot:TRINITY_DN523_c0_g1_i1.p1 TRINITY_DN523_c0_g1~~TRINITY_DN523_c0_g1_i1.p1  ORF type:complete len:644 (-),score=247.66 TRINITY_DN523_c0_g1_i1:129-2060(-)
MGSSSSSLVKTKINNYKKEQNVSSCLVLSNLGLSSFPGGGLCIPNVTDIKISNLDLSKNSLKFIPESVQHMHDLTTINLSYNEFQSVEPLALIPNLTDIDLSFNLLLRVIPDFPKCKKLSLSTTRVSPLPPHVRLSKIEELNLSSMKLTVFPREVFSFSTLQILNLEGNEFNKVPEDISSLKCLTSLNLSANPIAALPESFENLAKTIKELRISKTRTLNKIPVAISKMKLLEILDLSFAELTEVDINFNKLTKLRVLDMSGNRIANFTQHSAFSIASLSSLESANFSKNKIIIIPRQFGYLGKTLKTLNFSDNLIGKLPGELSYLNPASVTFELDNNPLKDPFFSLFNQGLGVLITALKPFCGAYGPNCYLTEELAKPMPVKKGMEYVIQTVGFNGDKLEKGKDKFQATLTCKKGQLKGQTLDIIVKDNKDSGLYWVFFNISEEGLYEMSIDFEGRAIKGSPFVVRTEQFLNALVDDDFDDDEESDVENDAPVVAQEEQQKKEEKEEEDEKLIPDKVESEVTEANAEENKSEVKVEEMKTEENSVIAHETEAIEAKEIQPEIKEEKKEEKKKTGKKGSSKKHHSTKKKEEKEKELVAPESVEMETVVAASSTTEVDGSKAREQLQKLDGIDEILNFITGDKQ